MKKLTTLAVACAIALTQMPAALAQTTPYRAVATAPRITGFDVEQVPQLSPGTELGFTVWGTPGAQASLQIDGAQRPLSLIETGPGVYKGVYTISQRDRLQPNAQVSANLRNGNKVGSAVLDEVLQSGWQSSAAPEADGAPVIERFEVRHGGDRKAGNQLHFTLRGTPGGRAVVRLVGAQERFRLVEGRPGQYDGVYTIRDSDRLNPSNPIVARLKVGDRTISTTLENALDAKRLSSLRPAVACSDCATVLAVNRVEVEGDGSYVGGTVAGGLLGAVLGSQVGKGSGRTAAQVVGTVGGAVLGREIQKRGDKKQVYEVQLRMQDGSQQMLSFDNPPDFKAGDKVRLRDGQLSPQT